MEPNKIIDQEDNSQYPKQRPLAISIICILGFIGAALIIPVTFSEAAKEVGNWYPPYIACSGLLGFICMIGLWKMKKWAAYGYAVFVVINQLVMYLMGVWTVPSLIIPGIVTGIALGYLDSMD